MPTQIQWRRGNTAQTAAFTGALAEITVDTDKKTLVVHDGVTAGGFSLALESAQQDALAYAKANGAYDKANTANVIAQGAFNKVNVAFDVANTKFSASGGTISGDVSVTGNVTPVTDNTKYLGSPSYRWHTLYVGPGSIDIDGIKIQNTAGKLVVTGATDFTIPGAPGTAAISAHANAAFDTANTALLSTGAFAQANAAFAKANSAYDQAIIGTNLAQASFDAANNVMPQIQPSFNKANAAYDVASSGFAQANLAYNTANSGTLLAQDAFDRANTKFNSSGGTITGPVTINSDLTVTGNVSYTGNVTSVQITGNTGQFFGDAANGFQALYAGIPTGYTFQEQTVIQSTGSYDGFVQINVQNIDPGFNSSTDFVATNDNTAGDAYIDVGINSTTYNNPEYGLQHAGDGYVYVSANTTTGGGNLVFSTTASGRDIIFSTGGTLHENEVARFQDGVGLVMQGKPIKFADATTQNTAAVSTAYSAGIYDIANSAAYAANTKVAKSGDSMTGTLTLPTLAANTAVTINSVGTIVATTLTTTSNAQVTLDQFSNTAFRSARYQVQMENGLSYHSTEIGLIHDGSTAYINQYGDLMTNISLGTFDTTITLGQVKLLFTPANSTNTVVNAVRTSMSYTDTTPVDSFTAQASGTLGVVYDSTFGQQNYGYASGFPSYGTWTSGLGLYQFKYNVGGGTGFGITGSGTVDGKSWDFNNGTNVFTFDGTAYTVIKVRVGGSGGTVYTFTQGVSGTWTNYPSTNDEFNLTSYAGQSVTVEFQFIS